MALLATAYERPVDACIVAKLRRACERWTEGEKALAHIHLAHAGVPPCGEVQALRLFVADELLAAGVTPRTLMKAQGFDPAPLDLLKANFNQAQPRWAAGSGRDSGRWSGGASVETAGVIEWVARQVLQFALRAARRMLRPSETKPSNPEVVKPESKPFGSLDLDLPQPGYGEEISIPGLPDNIKGTDVTKSDAKMANYKADLTRSEFESRALAIGLDERTK